LNEGNRDGEIKKSVMMGFSRNYDGLFYKTSRRKNQTMEPLRTLLLGKDICNLHVIAAMPLPYINGSADRYEFFANQITKKKL
jgi:hypothetical protein